MSAILSIGALAGCSSDEAAKKNDEAAKNGTAQSQTSTPQASLTGSPLPTPPEGVGAINDLSKQSCTNKDGKWSFKGTLKNDNSMGQKFTVTLSVVDSKNYNVKGSHQIVEVLGPKQSKEVGAVDFFDSKKDKNRMCTVSVVKTDKITAQK